MAAFHIWNHFYSKRCNRANGKVSVNCLLPEAKEKQDEKKL